MSKRLHHLFFFLLFFGLVVYGQEEQLTDDLGEVSDSFQEHFFEALKQKAIENHELALTSLQKARDAASDEQRPVVYFEMGKNLASLKRYEEAEERFKQVLEVKSDQLDVLESLYDVYYQQKNYEAALPLVKRLSELDDDYKEDLANLYAVTGDFEKALELLDELDEAWGESAERDKLRRRIYAETGNAEGAIENLEKKIGENPKNEQDFLNLIFLYSEQGDQEMAFSTAKKLLEQVPASQKVHLALYKFYMDQGDAEAAIQSVQVVLRSSDIEREQKFRVLDDFISTATSDSRYEQALKQVLASFDGGSGGKVNEKLGQYFLARGDKEQALAYFKKGLDEEPDNFILLKNCLLLMIENKEFTEAAALSEKGLEIFPAQPLLYLVKGVSDNALGNSTEALDSLLNGLDFLFDNPQMERDFYLQISEAYSNAGNAAKAREYQQKAENIRGNN
jgi:tetratricopeptide (TPR) repeat protein